MSGGHPGREVRVLLVDDHQTVRAGIADLLGASPGFAVVGGAGDGPGGLAMAAALAPDVVLLDIQMPGGGIGVIGRLHAASPASAIVVFTMHTADQYRDHCLAAGAVAFLNKGCSPADLTSTVLLAARGRLPRRPAPFVPATGDDLSARERAVVLGIVRGERPARIAEELGIGVRSVSTYRARALAKLGLDTNAELVRWAIASGLDAEA